MAIYSEQLPTVSKILSDLNLPSTDGTNDLGHLIVELLYEVNTNTSNNTKTCRVTAKTRSYIKVQNGAGLYFVEKENEGDTTPGVYQGWLTYPFEVIQGAVENHILDYNLNYGANIPANVVHAPQRGWLEYIGTSYNFEESAGELAQFVDGMFYDVYDSDEFFIETLSKTELDNLLRNLDNYTTIETTEASSLIKVKFALFDDGYLDLDDPDITPQQVNDLGYTLRPGGTIAVMFDF